MRTLRAFGLAAAAAALAGTAIAANPRTPQTHVMSVPLPDGSVARVEYVGEVAPKVTVVPRPMADAGMPWAMPFPSFGGFDRIFTDMQRRSQEMMRRAQDMGHNAAAGEPDMAAYGSLPAGETSSTVVSVTNGGTTCTRTTNIVSQGPGKPPKVTTNAAGNCGGDARDRSAGSTNPA